MPHLYWIQNDKRIFHKKFISLLVLLIAFSSFGLFAQSLGVLSFPLTIDGESSGEIDVSIDDADGFLISSEQLQKKLSPILTQEILQTLGAMQPWVSSEELNSIGISAAVDEANLSVSIILNPKQKAIRTISLTTSNSLQLSDNLLEPANFSFNINISANQVFNFETQTDNFLQSSPLSLTITPNAVIKGWFLSSSIGLQTNTDSSFTLDTIFLQKDFENLGITFTAGNFRSDTIHFQSNPASFGLLLTSLNSDSSTYRSTFSRNLYLDEKSRVEVYINNSLRKTFLLPSGRYVLDNFSLTQGINDISLEIVPELGVVRTETYKLGYDYNTLPKNETQYSYGIGYESRDIDWTTLPVFFGKQKFGVTDNFTAGFGFQANDTYQFAGVDTIWATAAGNLTLSGAVSHLNNLGAGSALYTGYTYSRKDYPQFGLSGTYYSDLFRTNGAAELISSKPLFSLSVSSGYSFWKTLSLSGSVTMEAARDTPVMNISGNLHASVKISNALRIAASTSFTDKNGAPDWSGSLRITYHPDSRTTISTNSNINNGDTSINYYNSPERWNGNGSISASASGISADNLLPETLSASENYKTQLFDLAFRQQVSMGETFADPVTFSTSITASTAISYADGLFGMSRPINDGFVIVGPKYDTEGLTLGIRTSNTAVSSSSNIFGTVVVPNISSNTNNKIEVDIIDMPKGFDPGQNTATFNPSRGQGAAFRIGTDAIVYAQGRLLYADGLPASLLLGTVSALDDTLFGTQYIFTDQKGVFFIYSLKTGRYKIQLEVDGWEDYILEIKPGMAGLINLGDFYLPKIKKSSIVKNTLIDSYTSPTMIISEETIEEDIDKQENIAVIPAQSDPAPEKSVSKDVFGKLLFEDKTGVAFSNGGIVKVNDDSFESLFFTTDSNGDFYISSLAPGGV